MDNFRIQAWGQGYPGFYISFENAEQLGVFAAALKTYENEPGRVAKISDVYEFCINMPKDKTEDSFKIKSTDYQGIPMYRIAHVEKIEEKVFHVAIPRSWGFPTCLVLDLNGTIKGDDSYFGPFESCSYYPSKFHEILEKVARNNPDNSFSGTIYADDGDHYSDTAKFSYSNRVLTVDYTDECGDLARHSVSVEI